MIKINNLNKIFGDKSVLNNLKVEFNGGLNYILGPSGSGKTTLLKILSGIDNDYTGEVLFKGKEIKNFSSSELNSYYYNSVGFIWQNFNLIDHLTVEENIEMVLNLGGDSSDKIREKIKPLLKSLAIEKICNQKISTLSGGQKQRVAIARVLVKDPEVIIADEPTGALDKGSAKIIMGALKKISKTKVVIVVTHDKSVIDDDANVYELYKGTLTQKTEEVKKSNSINKSDYVKPSLSIGKAFRFGIKNFKGLILKNILTAIVIAFSSIFLLINFSGEIVNEQEDIINKLVQEKGNSIREIGVLSSRMNLIGGVDRDGKPQPDRAFKQDVSEFLNKYYEDPRVEYFRLEQFINNISINIPGITENHVIKSTSTGATFDDLIEGSLPKLEGREVVVSEKLVENLGLLPSDVIGKTINVKATTYDNTEPIRNVIDLSLDNLTIVGVIESSFNLRQSNGQMKRQERDDSMYFSLDIVNEIKEASGGDIGNASFNLRVKDIKDVMPIVDELNEVGIIAVGEFENAKDILRISDISNSGAKAMTAVLAVIGIMSIIIITIINFYLRKYEFSVLKINGYSKISILKLNMVEAILLSVIAMVMMTIIFVPISSLIFNLFSIKISGANSLILGCSIVLIVSVLSSILGFIISSNIDVSKELMKGDR